MEIYKKLMGLAGWLASCHCSNVRMSSKFPIETDSVKGRCPPQKEHAWKIRSWNNYFRWSSPGAVKQWMLGVPSGELTFCYGKSPFSMGKSTISMAIFNSKLFVHQRALALQERTSNPKRAKRRSASCCPGPFHSSNRHWATGVSDR